MQNWNPDKIDTEWLSFRRGLRPAIRIAVGPDWVDSVHKRFRNMGAKVERSDAEITIDGRVQWILYVSHESATATNLKQNEAPLFFEADSLSVDEKCDRHRVMGAYLGFPKCCVESYCQWTARGVGRLREGSDIMASETYIAAREAWVPQPSWLLNDLFTTQRVRLVSFYPCSYDCSEATALAEKIVLEIERHHPERVDGFCDRLRQDVALGSWGQLGVVSALERVGAAFRVEAAEAPPGPEGRQPDQRDVEFCSELKGSSFGADGLQVARDEPMSMLFRFGPAR